MEERRRCVLAREESAASFIGGEWMGGGGGVIAKQTKMGKGEPDLPWGVCEHGEVRGVGDG
jgi:hypothetical protein